MTDHTRVPYFPTSLEDYAPWVAAHGLLYPYEKCQCGCNQYAPIAKVTRRKSFHLKGEPMRYVFGHHPNMHHLQSANPSGLCMCGCGMPTQVAKTTNTRRGNVAGKPTRFLPNHYTNLVLSLADRFWEKVDKRGPNDCWLWTARHNGRGYGTIMREGGQPHKSDYAHRVSYELHIGPIPDGMFVCHSCDRPACVNPAHLWLGTPADNMADMVAKGRQNYVGGPAGEKASKAKLKESDVVEILDLLDAGVMQRVIAAQFNVSQTAISYIWRGLSWRHLSHRAARHDQVFAKLARVK